jgi:hypothetical protein
VGRRAAWLAPQKGADIDGGRPLPSRPDYGPSQGHTTSFHTWVSGSSWGVSLWAVR